MTKWAQYKRKLRSKGTMRKNAGLASTGYTCPGCLYRGDAMDEPDGMLPSDCPNCGLSGYTLWDDDPDLINYLTDPEMKASVAEARQHQLGGGMEQAQRQIENLPEVGHPLGRQGAQHRANHGDPGACPNCGSLNAVPTMGDFMQCSDCGYDWDEDYERYQREMAAVVPRPIQQLQEMYDMPSVQNPQDPYLEARHGPWHSVWQGGRLMDVYHDESDVPLDAIEAGHYNWEAGGPFSGPAWHEAPTAEGVNQRLREWANEYGDDYIRNQLPYQ